MKTNCDLNFLFHNKLSKNIMSIHVNTETKRTTDFL